MSQARNLERDIEVLRQYLEGVPASVLAKDHGLTLSSINQIVFRISRRSWQRCEEDNPSITKGRVITRHNPRAVIYDAKFRLMLLEKYAQHHCVPFKRPIKEKE